MKTLIVFATTEGHTRKIARHIADAVRGAGHDCNLFDAEVRNTEPDIESFDVVLVAGSVHQKRHQNALADFARTHCTVLDTRPNAMISVSLIVTTPGGEEEARGYVDEFAAETGWQPKHVHLAAGAMRYLEYDFFKAFTIQQIVFKGRKEMPDKAGGNPEYTDWEALDAFVAGVLSEAG